MKLEHIRLYSGLIMICCVPIVWAQQPAQGTLEKPAVPRLVQFSGIIKEAAGKPVAGVTFALYKDQEGGAPIWLETQNVPADENGRYTVMLGATRNDGLPMELFTSGEARWLGIQPQGQPEQSRVLLFSVPYALKAADAETVGGLPASAFMLVAPPARSSTSSSTVSTDAATAALTVSGGGTLDFIPLWTPNGSTLGNSILFQSPSSDIGVGTGTPTAKLDVNGGTTVRGTLLLPATATATSGSGANSDPLELTASAFNSSTLAAVNETFSWHAEPVGNNTASPSATLNLLFGTSSLAETGLHIGSNGLINFASGQTFPGTGKGTVTSVGSGAGLTGGPITGSGTLSIATGGVTNTMLAHPSLTITAGTDLTGGGVVDLGGSTTLSLNTTTTDARYARLSAANTFTGNQAITGGLGISGNILGLGNLVVGSIALVPKLGVNQNTPRAALDVGDGGADTLFGGTGCGSGYTGLGFTTSGGLSGCTNYALLGGSAGDTFINSHGTATIHFRSNNNELATIDNSGNVAVIGQNGGGNLTVSKNLTVAGKVTSSNVAAQVSASNSTNAQVNPTSCTFATLTALDVNCQVPNMTLTTTTTNPTVLVMVNIGGVSTDPCAIANFYLFIDGNIVALSTVSYNSNNSRFGFEIGSLSMTLLHNLAPGSHTFQVQEATDFSGGSCTGFVSDTGVSEGDGGRGSLRTLIVREL